MSVETAAMTEAANRRRAWAPWLRVAGIAAALLLVSEAIWVWQTWPVRELLHPASLPARPANAR